jgi:hypothetical protein
MFQFEHLLCEVDVDLHMHLEQCRQRTASGIAPTCRLCVVASHCVGGCSCWQPVWAAVVGAAGAKVVCQLPVASQGCDAGWLGMWPVVVCEWCCVWSGVRDELLCRHCGKLMLL